MLCSGEEPQLNNFSEQNCEIIFLTFFRIISTVIRFTLDDQTMISFENEMCSQLNCHIKRKKTISSKILFVLSCLTECFQITRRGQMFDSFILSKLFLPFLFFCFYFLLIESETRLFDWPGRVLLTEVQHLALQLSPSRRQPSFDKPFRQKKEKR